jgi:hypothetical protein
LIDCEAKMHLVWWGCVGLIKPKTNNVFELPKIKVEEKRIP